MPSRTPISRRALAAVIGVVAAVIALASWAAVASVRSVDEQSDRLPVEMIHAVSAAYRPVVGAKPVAEVVPARMGGWTPQRGLQIAERAARWLNWPYSFGAGGEAGPSFGHSVDKDSRNDGHVYGFDCSGLTMYAVAPWRELDHDAASQYTEVGSFHPTLDTLQPGDLVFWSKDGTVRGIGHVAVYIGNGNVVQAPRSGDVVRVTPIYAVESGSMGATRPLT